MPMMEVASPATSSRNVSLDSPPPQPPATKQGGFFPPSQPEGGLGDLVNSPQLLTMQGLAMVKDAFQLISSGQPALAMILQNTLQDLEQLVAQTISATAAGQPPIGQSGPPGLPPPPMGMPPQGGMPPGMPPQGQM